MIPIRIGLCLRRGRMTAQGVDRGRDLAPALARARALGLARELAPGRVLAPIRFKTIGNNKQAALLFRRPLLFCITLQFFGGLGFGTTGLSRAKIKGHRLKPVLLVLRRTWLVDDSHAAHLFRIILAIEEIPLFAGFQYFLLL
jgi:hypothetical protein